ncbi:MAG: OmpH family outer membrane protein [Nevskia sp.]|nr:OmpH family outer membrane protein [Nevskia sp.]
MMRESVRAALGMAAVLSLAVAAPAMADLKIAVVRLGDLLQQSSAYKAASAKFQAEVKKRNDAIEAERKQLADDLQKYQRDAATMSPEQRDKTEKDLNTRQAQLDFDRRKAQEDLQNRDQELQAELLGKVKDVIYQVAKERGYDVVLTNAFAVNPSVDITDDVLKRLNQQTPSTGGGK